MQHFSFFLGPVLTYVLMRSTDSFCTSLVSFKVGCRFPHCWLLLTATLGVESTAMISRRHSNAKGGGWGVRGGRGNGQLTVVHMDGHITSHHISVVSKSNNQVQETFSNIMNLITSALSCYIYLKFPKKNLNNQNLNLPSDLR